MNVEWYSNKVKPVKPYCDESDIAIAMRGRILISTFYLPTDNTVYLNSFACRFPLNDPNVDGWCYVKDLYPKETKI